jgi:hypothetical protein
MYFVLEEDFGVWFKLVLGEFYFKIYKGFILSKVSTSYKFLLIGYITSSILLLNTS